MKLYKLHLLLLMLLFVNQHAASQIKESLIGTFGMKLIEAINSNDKEVQRKFVANNLDKRALEEGADAWVKKMSDLYVTSEGLLIEDVLPGRDPEEVRMIVTTRLGGRKMEVATHISREAPDKLMGFVSRPMENVPMNPSAQPTGPKPSLKVGIENILAQAVKDDKFSGVVFVAKDGNIVLNEANGFANREKQIPNRTDTKFNMGSMTKMFTSVAITQLVQAGKLSYQDRLISVLPNYPNKSIAEKITLHHLLTHTAGLGDFFKPDFFSHREKYVDLCSYLPLFVNEALLFEPGEDWAYSNAGFIVLGLIVEKVSGETYFDYVRNHICKPTGMRNTDFYARDANVKNAALGYTYDEGDTKPEQKRHPNDGMLPVKGSSAGGSYSTAEDLFRFSKALLEYRLVNEELTRTIITGKVNDNHRDSKYAYGFMDEVKSGTHVIGHNGGGPGINGRMNILPDKGYTLIVLSNYSPPSADQLASEITALLLSQ